MISFVRTKTLRALRADAAAARGLRADAEGACAELEGLRVALAAAEHRTEVAADAVTRAEAVAKGVARDYSEAFAARVRAERERDAARAEAEGRRADTGQQVEARTNECQLCGAPGGYPYCNADCRAADLADHDCQWPDDCAGCSRD